MNLRQPFTVNFKIVRTAISKPFEIDLAWTMSEFIRHMKEYIFYDYLLDNVDLVDDTERNNYEGSVEDGPAIQPSNMTVFEKYKNKINYVAFYIRPRTPPPAQNEQEHIATETFNHNHNHTCVICLTQERNVVFSPCHHLCACSDCGTNPSLTSCPLCRTNIGERLTVYV